MTHPNVPSILPIDAKRTEFEKWADNRGYDLIKYVDGVSKGQYRRLNTESAWDGWQAATTSRQQFAEELVRRLEEIKFDVSEYNPKIYHLKFKDVLTIVREMEGKHG